MIVQIRDVFDTFNLGELVFDVLDLVVLEVDHHCEESFGAVLETEGFECLLDAVVGGAKVDYFVAK